MNPISAGITTVMNPPAATASTTTKETLRVTAVAPTELSERLTAMREALSYRASRVTPLMLLVPTWA
jgi:hypothetical protein